MLNFNSCCLFSLPTLSSEIELFDVIKQYSISFYAKTRNILGEYIFKGLLAILCLFGGATKYQGLVRLMGEKQTIAQETV